MTLVYYSSLLVIFLGLYLGFVWLFFMIKDDLISDAKLISYPKITIAVPAHNEEKIIAKTITSILSQRYPKDKLKVIVVDDGSTDSTYQVLQRFRNNKRVKLIRKKRNHGKAAALNTALRFTNTPYFSCVDADSELDRDALRNNMKYFQDGVGAVISIIKVRNPHGLLGVAQYVEYVINSLYRRVFALNDFLTVTPGVLSVYRTDVIKKVGGFDTHSVTEDFEIALRIIKAGYKIEMCPDSFTYTEAPLDLKSFWHQRVRWYRGFFETYAKHKDMVFSLKYGLLSSFFIPLSVLGPFLLFLAISLILYKSGVQLYRFLFKLFFAYNTIKWFHINSLIDTLYETNYFIEIPVWTSIAIVLYFLLKAVFFSNERVNLKTVIGTIIYLLVFPYLTMFQWIHAFWLVIRKREKRW